MVSSAAYNKSVKYKNKRKKKNLFWITVRQMKKKTKLKNDF